MLHYAHSSNSTGNRQLLRDHLLNVAHQAAIFATPLGEPQLGDYAGRYHDIGKYHSAFQEYLLQAEQGLSLKGHGPDHKGAGALLALQKHLEVLAFIIAGHHGGLPSRATLKIWLRERVRDPHVQEALVEASRHFPELADVEPSQSLLPQRIDTPLQGELFIRLLYSALVDADFLDTEKHFRPRASAQRENTLPLAVLWSRFEIYQQQQRLQTPPTQLNTLREQVYEQCCNAAHLPPGFFRLTVPTGGGKTRSSLAFALRHASLHHLDRVIYAIPYMSITEQTADIFRAIFPDPLTVLEHHSGIVPPDDPENATAEELWQRLASENWDAPVIVTTTVQLFESLMAHKPSACRKLHNITRSILILDEAQTLPTHLLEPILDVLQELVRRYSVTVVLCTATQPALDERTGFPGLRDIREIISDTPSLFTHLARVDYQWPQPSERWSWKQVAEQARTVSQSLVIVNTRADAKQVAEALADSSPLLLSNSLCGAHRREVLKDVRRRLQTGEACHLVSTQLIEAGVDIDFALVLRALGPLDSIAQAAGRCNREGKLTSGRVLIFNPLEGTLPPGPYRTGTQLTQALLQQGIIDMNDPTTYRHYFMRYYALVQRDEPQIQQVRLQLDYPEVAHRFHMIGEETIPVIVDYQSADRPMHVVHLLKEVQQQTIQRRSILRQLQPYMVQLRASVFAAAIQQKQVQELLPGLWIWQGTYDAIYGLIS